MELIGSEGRHLIFDIFGVNIAISIKNIFMTKKARIYIINKCYKNINIFCKIIDQYVMTSTAPWLNFCILNALHRQSGLVWYDIILIAISKSIWTCTSLVIGKLYQLFQVLLGQPRVAVALLLELVARRLGHDGHFLRFEPATGLRRPATARCCRGV